MFLVSQIREKLAQLQEKRDRINKKWQDKMDHLQIGMGAEHVICYIQSNSTMCACTLVWTCCYRLKDSR